jgi:flagellar P-ring protein precursor FlgI
MGWLRAILAATLLFAAAPAFAAGEVRIKDMGHFLGWRENALVGYGVVTGLSGTGDMPRNEATQQSLRNVMARLGITLSPDQIQSRNVAVVMITATLPPTANVGDKIDITVASVGDARSLAGGSLLMAPLYGPDQKAYALAQGSLLVGGYRFDANMNQQQRNFPTTGQIPGGATIEQAVRSTVLDGEGNLTFVLSEADFTTISRVADGVDRLLGQGSARILGADSLVIASSALKADPFRTIASIENVRVTPDGLARVVINERTGTVVAGADVQISSVVVSKGDIRVTVSIDNQASQPTVYGLAGADVRSLVVANTKLTVTKPQEDAVVRFPNTTVGDLVEALRALNVDTRGVISVLDAIKSAGALHADIIVQ